MFQFSGFAPYRVLYLQYSGLPHSDICGSHRVCQSPQLFAAYHVLLRLWEPQASPIRPYFAYCTFMRRINTAQLCFLYFSTFWIYLNMSMNLWRIATDNHISSFAWWRISESNRWPPACKAGALASWANPPFFKILQSDSKCGFPASRISFSHRQNIFKFSNFQIFKSKKVVPGRLELPTPTLSV